MPTNEPQLAPVSTMIPSTISSPNDSPVAHISNGLARPGVLPPRLYPDDEFLTDRRNSCILSRKQPSTLLSARQDQRSGSGDPDRWKRLAAQKMLQNLGCAANSAPNFVCFVRALHLAGYTLSATKRGVTVSHGLNDWSDRDPRSGFIHDKVSFYLGRGADFTPGGLAHKYLTLRLLWIERSGFEQDLGAIPLLMLREPILVLDFDSIRSAVGTAFIAFPGSNDSDARWARFKDIVFGGLVAHRREHETKI